MGSFLQDTQPPRGCGSINWLRSGAWLLLPSPLVIAFRLGADIIMRPSCATGWFYYKPNCYGYFRKLRSWSDAEVRSLARAWTGCSGARGHPELQVSLDSRRVSGPPWLSEKSPCRSAFSSFTDGARALCPDPRPQTGRKDVRTNEKQPLPSRSPLSVRQKCVNPRRMKRGPWRKALPENWGGDGSQTSEPPDGSKAVQRNGRLYRLHHPTNVSVFFRRGFV